MKIQEEGSRIQCLFEDTFLSYNSSSSPYAFMAERQLVRKISLISHYKDTNLIRAPPF